MQRHLWRKSRTQTFSMIQMYKNFCRFALGYFCSVGSKFFSDFYGPGSIPGNARVIKKFVRWRKLYTLTQEWKDRGFNWHLAGKQSTIFHGTSGILYASKAEFSYERPDCGRINSYCSEMLGKWGKSPRRKCWRPPSSSSSIWTPSSPQSSRTCHPATCKDPAASANVSNISSTSTLSATPVWNQRSDASNGFCKSEGVRGLQWPSKPDLVFLIARSFST